MDEASPKPMPPSPAEQARWFAEDVQPHEPALRAYLRRRFSELHDIDDLVQDSYVRLLAARRTGPIASAKAYLFTTARNAAISLLRRPRIFSTEPVTAPGALAVPDGSVAVPDAVSTRQEIEILRAAVETLPPRCREVFVLHKLQGLAQKEVAAQLGLSLLTVQVQVARGTARCTKYLRRHGVFCRPTP